MRRSLVPAASLVFAVVVSCSASAARADELAAEARQRNDALVGEGFNVTRGISVASALTKSEWLVPPSDDAHVIALWFAVAGDGDIAARVVAPTGEVIMAARARRAEERVSRALAPGRYVLELGGAKGRAVLGIKGPAIGDCAVEHARVSEHAAQPSRGYHWPYLLLAPATSPTGVRALLVAPNNSGFESESLELLRASAMCQLREHAELAERLGVAVLVPLFPRPAMREAGTGLYLHALSRAALETKLPRFARVDLQLIAMIDDARAALGGGVDGKVLMSGFSAAAMFANRFALLHPERVRAAAVGSPGGWPTAPLVDASLPYPVGLGDAAALTGAPVAVEAMRRVRFLFLLGDADENDSVTHRDSFSAADESSIARRFGKTPVARWEAARRLYEGAGMAAQFQLYRGVGHAMSAGMRADVEAFLRAAMAGAP